jgi:hypothetical protein
MGVGPVTVSAQAVTAAPSLMGPAVASSFTENWSLATASPAFAFMGSQPTSVATSVGPG